MPLKGEHLDPTAMRQKKRVILKSLIGKALIEQAENNPQFVDQLKSLLVQAFTKHDEYMYPSVIEQYLRMLSSDDLPENPFFTAYIDAVATSDEVTSLSAAFVVIAQLEEHERVQEIKKVFGVKFSELAYGLQYFVLNSGLVPTLSKELHTQKATTGRGRWAIENPDRMREIQQKMTRIRAENSQPTVFTEDIKAYIQNLFDHGNNYEEVSELLAIEHVNNVSA
jgi:hypothetical protein